MIPDLNQTVNIYTQAFSAGGDSLISLLYSNLRARVSLSEKFLRQAGGDYVQIDGSCWIDGDPELTRDMILNFGDYVYTIFSVQKTRDLNGNPLFQYLTLKINKNASI